jgi:beta-glucosidase/6-phospho-beta-glucosidase/beta-galactosidase
MSIGWSRIYPNGYDKEPNEEGLLFYDHVIDALLEAGIRLEQDGTSQDDYRIEYLSKHIEQMKKAIYEDGVDLISFKAEAPLLKRSRVSRRSRGL